MINVSDLLPRPIFSKIRDQQRPVMLRLKEKRRVFLGPHCHIMFENKETILWQIQEMLRIEPHGDAEEEIEAYKGLMPTGSDLRATVMFEIADSQERRALLKDLGHIEDHFYLCIGKNRIQGLPVDPEVERTTSEGKTSAVHFIYFPLTKEEKESFSEVSLLVGHPQYQYETLLSEDTISALRKDLA